MAVSVMLYIVALASAPRMLLLNSQLRLPTARFLIARSADFGKFIFIVRPQWLLGIQFWITLVHGFLEHFKRRLGINPCSLG